jgi:putative transposase
MVLKYHGNEGGCFFVTTSVVDFIPVFGINNCADIVVASVKFCQNKFKFHISVYVIMPHHLHILFTIPESIKLGDVMRDFKKYTSVAIKKYLAEKGEHELIFRNLCNHAPLKPQRSFKLWQDRYDSVAIYSEEVYATKFNYIVNNPARAGLVERPEDYPYLFFGGRLD